MPVARRWASSQILPDWFYAGVLDTALVLAIDPAYFPDDGRHRAMAILTGAQAWRATGSRAAGSSTSGIRTRKSGARPSPTISPATCGALVARQSLPGGVLGIERMPDGGAELLTFRPVPYTARG